MKRRQNGFTLIELLLVMVILTVLAAIVVPKFTGRAQQAKLDAAKTQLNYIEGALNTFEVDTGRFPTADEGLQALVVQPSNVTNWHAYLEHGAVPADPWGNAYVYHYPGTHNTNGFDLYSMGPDGREGNDDITNWQQ
ncbi:MAG TPA: type II secretion system major pseudopilin GspG [Tepidisphaeraceae bacterium]|nr:type II secretion system major pseudopilin GspG [Tepidisphaeraceae bacterium]